MRGGPKLGEDHHALGVERRLYRALLLLYPEPFRRRYELEERDVVAVPWLIDAPAGDPSIRTVDDACARQSSARGETEVFAPFVRTDPEALLATPSNWHANLSTMPDGRKSRAFHRDNSPSEITSIPSCA